MSEEKKVKHDERAIFEAWAVDNGFDVVRYGTVEYEVSSTEFAWMAWQSRAAFPQRGEQAMALTDIELTTLIRKVEDKLGIVWFVPDDSERFAWRTTDTYEQLKYARALLTAANLENLV